MPDQDQCIRDRFDPDLALRETFAHKLRTEDQDILGALCGAVLELTREADAICRQLKFGWPHNVAAAAADLRYLSEWLAYEGAAEGDCLEPWQRRFAYVAERAAPDVLAVAEMLEKVIEELGDE